MNRAHCTNAWLIFTRKKEGSHLDLGLSWDKVGREEPEERKGQGAWWALFRGHYSNTLSPSPSAFLPTLPTVTEEGPLGARSWASAGMEKGRDPLLVTQYCWIIPHPHHAPLTLTQLVSPACARKMLPEGAFLRRLKARYRHWSDGSLQPREEEGGKGLRHQPGQVPGPRA